MQEFGAKYRLDFGEPVTRACCMKSTASDAFMLDGSIAVFWCFPGDPTEDTP